MLVVQNKSHTGWTTAGIFLRSERGGVQGNHRTYYPREISCLEKSKQALEIRIN
jgi:hypothetical protein